MPTTHSGQDFGQQAVRMNGNAVSKMTSADPSKTAVGWGLRPIYSLRSKIPFQRLLGTFINVEFSGPGMKRALDELVRDKEELSDAIDTSAVMSGGAIAKPSLIFEPASDWLLSMYDLRHDALVQTHAWKMRHERIRAGVWRQILKMKEVQDAPKELPLSEPLMSGTVLLRREHASIEVTSPTGTRIVFDPIFRSAMLQCAAAVPPPGRGIAAAFVTHSHSDHFNIATLDYLAADGTRIFVPSVPRPNMLAMDMRDGLELCGIAAASSAWGGQARVNDVNVEVLPFFGEQPSAQVATTDRDVRNWGNCYRVDTEDLSVLMLSDTGADPQGNMLQVISDSVSRIGPIDVVIGCLRDFYSPFEVAGLSSYYFALPVDGLRSDYDLYRRRSLQSTTLGMSGTARACAEARAKVFLPYAHGLTGYGQPLGANPFGPGADVSEASACRALAAELDRIGCSTSVGAWNPGDRWTLLAS
jgi:beta-lactamase family protein